MEKSVLFEQPATEHIRFCLRLEHLQQQLRHTQMGTGLWDSYHCINVIVDILRLLDRHDLRTKLNQELTRLLLACKKLASIPHIDQSKLTHLQDQIDHLCTLVHQSKGMFAQELRENEFIQTIYRYHAHPSGTCKHQAPALHLWLIDPVEKRHQDLKKWIHHFDDIFSITGLLLRIVRDSGAPKLYRAESGFYQMPLDPQIPVQMLRLEYPSEFAVIPKVSIGRHGLSVRFLTCDVETPSEQSSANIDFFLTLCNF